MRSLVAIGVAVTTLAVAAPAHAGRYLTASRSGVEGNADVDFESATRAYPIRMYVKDTSCNSNDVYVRFIVYHPGGAWTTQKRRNSNGCDTSIEWNNLYIHDGRRISAVQLEACEDNAGGDDCALSVVEYNPYVQHHDLHVKPILAGIEIAGTKSLPGPDGIISYEGRI